MNMLVVVRSARVVKSIITSEYLSIDVFEKEKILTGR